MSKKSKLLQHVNINLNGMHICLLNYPHDVQEEQTFTTCKHQPQRQQHQPGKLGSYVDWIRDKSLGFNIRYKQ